ncbi:universal stress protein [Gordonia spumicola]|uniref:Universal stress protein n=1 Tax=Gordonia spumicola TaxID=589161 RepID=A0A7I9VEV0_9ACTN|nr:universal stress protein [Gordonia spumicola]GEE03888.1 universal stress protein [Gordonia spumicola]
MTVLAGFSASRKGSAPVALASQIARTTGEDVVAAAVVERRMPVAVDPVEDEYIAYVAVQAERALLGAVDDVRGGPGVRVEVVQAPSIRDGLASAAAEHSANLVTVGSSSSGVLGRIALGSVTEQLVHTAEVPVAIAPRGYQPGAVPITRLTAAFGGKADVNGLIKSAAELSASWNVPLRVASFNVRDVSGIMGTTDPAAAENLVLQKWWTRTRDDIDQQLEEACHALATVTRPQIAVGVGRDWSSAVNDIDWQAGDMLLLGSGAAAQLQHVFLGTAAARIVRSSPVPVMILPRGKE